MVILNAKFREFIEPAPVCSASAGISLAAEMFHQQTCDRIVVVDDSKYPIGLVHLHELLPFLGGKCAYQPLSTLLKTDSLPCVVQDQRLSEYMAELEYSPVRFWAVIDRDRNYLGVVNIFYLRKFLAIAAPDDRDDSLRTDLDVVRARDLERLPLKFNEGTGAGAKLSTLTNPSESQHQIQSEGIPEAAELPADMVRLKRQLRWQIDQLRTQVQTHSLVASTKAPLPRSLAEPVAALRSLMQFLERLPLPLMLQTTAGDVVARNIHWQQQLGDLVDPGWVRREAAAILEYAMPPPEADVNRQPLENTVGHLDEEEPPLAMGSCQVGATPNTCICICPLKSGQERTLQFIKIPLGDLLSGRELEIFSAVPSWSESPFKLATLDGVQPGMRLPSPALPEEDLWLVLAQDVTEQHHLARELAAKNADLVHLNRLKDEFLACISHELRTPLTAVLGLSGLLKDQLSGSLNERQVRYANLIHKSGRHLMTIVNDILDLTRIESGQLELALEPVTIATVCDRAFEQAQNLCFEEHESDADPGTPAFSYTIEPGLETLVADELRLRQMLVHLLSNALKFTEASGVIGLDVSLWEGWIAFTVWDTGIGIPAEKQHLIFQKFQQLENPLTRRFEGAGLGLVLTQRLARLHGGDISFTSEEHQGSQFTLLLPPTHPQPTRTIGGMIHRPTQNRLVLIVEAVVRSLENLAQQLGELGYRFVVARSGTEAVEKARRLQPCAVFLNPLLPTLSGWDVLTLLKADAQTRGIPVIVMGTRNDRTSAYRNQADGFLSLPIAKKPLKQILSQFTEAASIESSKPESNLVVLRISPTRYADLHRSGPEAAIDLNALLHSHNYRVLEADDLEQAELLAQVWKPNVVVLDPAMPDPTAYLKRLGEQSFLSSLPLVTLDIATTQAANQVSGLTVFPCLAPLVEPSAAAEPSEPSALLQVIQVAAGFAWRPLVLALDAAKLGSVQDAHPKESEWLQALIQYLQTAGFRGMVARSHSEALQKLQTRSVDLLLVYWHETDLDDSSRDVLNAIEQLPHKPPVLVIDHYSTADGNRSSQLEDEIFAVLNNLSTHTLPPLPMEELLSQINQILTN